jgi:hypothetical protein
MLASAEVVVGNSEKCGDPLLDLDLTPIGETAKEPTKPDDEGDKFMTEGRVVRAHHLRLLLLPALFIFAALMAAPADAQPATWTQAGVLRCRLNPSIGFIIFGHQSMECTFRPAAGPPQAYEGAINTVGLDIGVTKGGGLAWAVFGPAEGFHYGALAGDYVGASADIGVGVGAGANVLVGGSNRSVALQPLSLEGSVALDVVAGLSQLKLRAVQ